MHQWLIVGVAAYKGDFKYVNNLEIMTGDRDAVLAAAKAWLGLPVFANSPEAYDEIRCFLIKDGPLDGWYRALMGLESYEPAEILLQDKD